MDTLTHDDIRAVVRGPLWHDCGNPWRGRATNRRRRPVSPALEGESTPASCRACQR